MSLLLSFPERDNRWLSHCVSLAAQVATVTAQSIDMSLHGWMEAGPRDFLLESEAGDKLRVTPLSFTTTYCCLETWSCDRKNKGVTVRETRAEMATPSSARSMALDKLLGLTMPMTSYL